MAQGTMADFKIYDEQFYGGQYEFLSQNLNLFNEASSGAFVLESELVKGQFEREAFLKNLAVANVTIYAGTVATFGKPTVVIDAPGLITAGAPNTYNLLALVPGAVTVKECEKDTIISQPVTGVENIGMRIQGEYAMNVSL